MFACYKFNSKEFKCFLKGSLENYNQAVSKGVEAWKTWKEVSLKYNNFPSANGLFNLIILRFLDLKGVKLFDR